MTETDPKEMEAKPKEMVLQLHHHLDAWKASSALFLAALITVTHSWSSHTAGALFVMWVRRCVNLAVPSDGCPRRHAHGLRLHGRNVRDDFCARPYLLTT